jgi:hypothetical protein
VADGKESLMSGKATLTTVASRKARNAPKDAIIRTRAGGVLTDFACRAAATLI